MAVLVRAFSERESDIRRCREIYNDYVQHTTVTFEEEVLDDEAMARRLRTVARHYPVLVLETDGMVMGFAYLHAFNERAAYRYTVDLSIYLDRSVTAHGYGGQLLAVLEAQAEARGFRTVVANITGENKISRSFHEKHGFVYGGVIRRAGYKQGRWLDIVYYQKDLPNGGR